MSANFEFHMNHRLVMGELNATYSTRLQRAALFLEAEIKRKLTRGGHTGKEYPVPGTQNRTHVASAEGEAPAVLFGRLVNSISHEMKVDPDELMAVVGSNLDYAARLEFGFMEKDSLGRQYHQGPRPYFRSTYEEQRERIKRIIEGG